jgi:hypothetical protein
MTDTDRTPTESEPLTREQITARVIDMIDNGDETRNGIARALGITPQRVSKIATSNGRGFDASRTELARQARLLDVKKAQADLAQMFLVRANEALRALDEPVDMVPTYVAATPSDPGGWKAKRLARPSISDQRSLAQIAALSAKTARDLLGSTTSGDVQSGVGMLRGLAEAFGQAAETMDAAGADDPTVEP